MIELTALEVSWLLLPLIGIFIFGINLSTWAVIHVYGYLGNVKAWFWKCIDDVLLRKSGTFNCIYYFHILIKMKICNLRTILKILILNYSGTPRPCIMLLFRQQRCSVVQNQRCISISIFKCYYNFTFSKYP